MNSLLNRNLPPILKALSSCAAKNIRPFHMPGHMTGKGLPELSGVDLLKLDLTELKETGALHPPKGSIDEACSLAASAFGADRSYILVNGSTCGIAASIHLTAGSGRASGSGLLLAGRDSHVSVSNACALYKIPLRFINGRFDIKNRYPLCVSLEDTAEAMEKYPDAAAVLITSPNYYGMAAETEKIADLVHSRGKLLIVDEAHGAHLSFAEGILTDEGKGSAFPEDALRSGADIVVQSAHKTLPALTQTAFLHIKYRDSYLSARDGDRLERILASMQTTSPSWLLMASADLARDIMMREGYSKLKQLFTDIIMSERKYGIFNACTDSNSTPGKDPTRLVFNTEDTGMSGYAFAGILAEKYNINVEMSDLFNVVCIATVSHNKYDIEYLFKSISDAKAAIKQDASIKQCNKEECAANAAAYLVKAPKAEMEIYEAFHSNEVLLNIEDSTGRISAGTIVPYPPGIPVLHPGEVITEEHIRALNLLARQGAEINGISYGKLMVIEL